MSQNEVCHKIEVFRGENADEPVDMFKQTQGSHQNIMGSYSSDS
jgi:hypothetical protein